MTLEMHELEQTFEEAWDAAFEAEFAAGGFQESQEAYQRFDRAGLEAVIARLSVYLDVQGRSMAAGELRAILATSEVAAGRENGGSKETFPPTHCGSTVRAGYEPQPVAVNVANPVASDVARDSGSDTDPAASSHATDQEDCCRWEIGNRGYIANCDRRWMFVFGHGETNCPNCKKPIAYVQRTDTCTCKIEMATFRDTGTTCAHCEKVIA